MAGESRCFLRTNGVRDRLCCLAASPNTDQILEHVSVECSRCPDGNRPALLIRLPSKSAMWLRPACLDRELQTRAPLSRTRRGWPPRRSTAVRACRTMEAFSFEPDHRSDRNVARRREGGVPRAGIVALCSDDVQHERHVSSVAEARGQQIEKRAPEIYGWPIRNKQNDRAERVGQPAPALVRRRSQSLGTSKPQSDPTASTIPPATPLVHITPVPPTP